MSASFTEGLSSFFSSYGLLIVLMVAMFAIMIIPQRRRDKKVKDMLGSLKAGDRVRTIGGVYGTISTIKDDTVILLVGPDKVKLVFARGAIAQVEDAGVLTLSKPCTAQQLRQAASMMSATRFKLADMEKKTATLEEKMEEIRLVNRAKWLLIERRNMDEATAHRYIEKLAMDARQTRRLVAQTLIRSLDND